MKPHRRRWLAAACGLAAAPWWLREAAATTALAANAGDAGEAAAGHPWLVASRRVGQGTLRVFGVHVYDASLFARADFDAGDFTRHPLVLEIRYRRKFAGAAIAERSLEEMRRQGELDEHDAQRWLRFMREAFPDVRPGDRLTGLWSPQEAASRFAANDGALRELSDAAFGPRFFGIWLAPQTSRPELRAQLLGMKAPS